MTTNYKGFREIIVENDELLEQLFSKGSAPLPDPELEKYQNLYIQLTSPCRPKNSKVLVKVMGNNLVPLPKRLNAMGLEARNREQVFALDALLDPQIQCVVLTGKPGTGKTLSALAAGMAGIEKKKYSRLILSKPMTQIGKHKLGTLPGEVNEKFHPYLVNYQSNFNQILSKNVGLDYVIQAYRVEFIPIQLFLGASFADTFLIVDEVQNLENIELGAILTRMGEGSKIIIMGDYKQVHDEIDLSKQGLCKLVNSPVIQASPLVAVVELQKCERSDLSALMASVFDE